MNNMLGGNSQHGHILPWESACVRVGNDRVDRPICASSFCGRDRRIVRHRRLQIRDRAQVDRWMEETKNSKNPTLLDEPAQ